MLSYRPIRRAPEHEASPLADFLSAFRQKIEHRWLFILLALLIPGIFVGAFIQQFTKEKDYHPPEVIFFQNWKANRSDAEIKRQQALDAPAEQAYRKAVADAEAKRRADMRAVAEAMGIDVDRERTKIHD
jgi:hypothetical protein